MKQASGESRFHPICDSAEPVYLHELLNPALRHVTQARGISRDQLCEMVGEVAPESALSPENLRHLSTDRAATFVNPLALAVVLARLGVPEMLSRMARAAGYTLTPMSGTEGTVCDILGSTAAYQQEVAESIAKVASSLQTGRITKARAAAILKELSEDDEKRATLARSIKAAMSSMADA